MSKEETIRAIRSRNHGAQEHFLAEFPVRHLADYLARLNALQGPPVRSSAYASWTRTSATPAIVCRTH